jgi:hypothetical protein
MPDVLLEIARTLGRPISPELPWQTYEQMLQAAIEALPPPAPSADGTTVDIWTTAQQQGGWWREAASPAQIRVPAAGNASVAYTEPQFDGAADDYPFHFLPYASQAFLDGSLAHLPWLQELPDVLSTAMWSSWI